MAGPRRLPDGRPAPDTAPDEEILDPADLRGLADALREGKKVGLSPDGRIHVFETPEGPPIDAASEAFVEDHLGEVQSFLRLGFNATIHPSGEITANSADGKFMYQADEVVALTAADRDGMRRMLAGGADVGITPDGSIQYTQNPGLPVRTAREADILLQMLDQEISSGRMAEQAAAGRGFLISGHVGHGIGPHGNYVDAPDIPGIRLPDPVPAPDAGGGEGGGAVAPPGPIQPVALTDAEEAERLGRYADDLDDRARLVREAAEAAARGDEARANELLDQSRIELVEEPPDLVPEPATQVPPGAGAPVREGEFDGPIGAADETGEVDVADVTAADGPEDAFGDAAVATSLERTFDDPVPAPDLGATADFAVDPADAVDLSGTEDLGVEALDA